MSMYRMEYRTSDRKRLCRLCNGEIPKDMLAITIKRLPKIGDIHLHRFCLITGLTNLKAINE